MFKYYGEEIIPIILNNFEIKDIIICGISDKQMVNQILKYCEENDASYVAIDSKNKFNQDGIIDYPLNVLRNFQEYDAIFINDDPNWYAVYNELNIVYQNNINFPLVFICNNIFPYSKNDSYINPDIIPIEFRKKCSEVLKYNDNSFYDGFFHAIMGNDIKNGVSDAIDDFLDENKDIRMMDIKLSNGTSILYSENSHLDSNFNNFMGEIENYNLNEDQLFDNIIKNQFLKNHVYTNNHNIINELNSEIIEKDKLISDYESKIKVHDDELNYKNSQINVLNSKLNLKDTQIKNFESKLINLEHSNHILQDELQSVNEKYDILKNESNQKEKIYSDNQSSLNNEISSYKSQISSLKEDIIKKEQLEDDLYIKLQDVNNEIKNKNVKIRSIKQQYIYQSSALNNKEYCISCFKEELENNHHEINYLKENPFTKKILSPFSFLYLIFKSKPDELSINFKLYRLLKSSEYFDIGYYLSNNEDIRKSKWCKYFSPELHYVCHGFDEKRKFNKKYFVTSSKGNLLKYLISLN